MSRLQVHEYVTRLQDEYGLKTIIGCELEFYLSDAKILDKISHIIAEVVPEKGSQQFELRFKCSDKIVDLLDLIEQTRNYIITTSKESGGMAYFDAKPFHDQPGSAFHVHLNFLNYDDKNAFDKIRDRESNYLLYSIGGLLATMQDSMPFFAPTKESYKRFIQCMETPITVSWGGNNRTTAIRIPPSNAGPRRIEHRVSGADVDFCAATGAILSGTYHGIKHRVLPPQKIYGNAFDEQYGLERLSPHK